ncbi:MAG: type II toxin-antitoxin system Phd/YefM family antitoxin [Anaerolineae bacterium]|uniref:type II toxin-antitoxin system prevent-host-death family antitoxin n=1 Tax=Candidatus Amarolinea dominans TaxID=3140696 RepID=UPI0031354F46|nr:type II toxin-antitoxin system Phd/YefM family antitoxin [Anaerolineae bacterium]
MDIRRLSVSELRLNTRDILEGVKFLHRRFVIATYGRPMAVVVNIEDWERLSGETLVDRAEEGEEREPEVELV